MGQASDFTGSKDTKKSISKELTLEDKINSAVEGWKGMSDKLGVYSDRFGSTLRGKAYYVVGARAMDAEAVIGMYEASGMTSPLVKLFCLQEGQRALCDAISNKIDAGFFARSLSMVGVLAANYSLMYRDSYQSDPKKYNALQHFFAACMLDTFMPRNYLIAEMCNSSKNNKTTWGESFYLLGVRTVALPLKIGLLAASVVAIPACGAVGLLAGVSRGLSRGVDLVCKGINKLAGRTVFERGNGVNYSLDNTRLQRLTNRSLDLGFLAVGLGMKAVNTIFCVDLLQSVRMFGPTDSIDKYRTKNEGVSEKSKTESKTSIFSFKQQNKDISNNKLAVPGFVAQPTMIQLRKDLITLKKQMTEYKESGIYSKEKNDEFMSKINAYSELNDQKNTMIGNLIDDCKKIRIECRVGHQREETPVPEYEQRKSVVEDKKQPAEIAAPPMLHFNTRMQKSDFSKSNSNLKTPPASEDGESTTTDPSVITTTKGDSLRKLI